MPSVYSTWPLTTTQNHQQRMLRLNAMKKQMATAGTSPSHTEPSTATVMEVPQQPIKRKAVSSEVEGQPKKKKLACSPPVNFDSKGNVMVSKPQGPRLTSQEQEEGFIGFRTVTKDQQKDTSFKLLPTYDLSFGQTITKEEMKKQYYSWLGGRDPDTDTLMMTDRSFGTMTKDQMKKKLPPNPTEMEVVTSAEYKARSKEVKDPMETLMKEMECEKLKDVHDSQEDFLSAPQQAQSFHGTLTEFLVVVKKYYEDPKDFKDKKLVDIINTDNERKVNHVMQKVNCLEKVKRVIGSVETCIKSIEKVYPEIFKQTEEKKVKPPKVQKKEVKPPKAKKSPKKVKAKKSLKAKMEEGATKTTTSKGRVQGSKVTALPKTDTAPQEATGKSSKVAGKGKTTPSQTASAKKKGVSFEDKVKGIDDDSLSSYSEDSDDNDIGDVDLF